MWPGVLVCSLTLQRTYNVAAILELNLAAHLNEIEILLIIERPVYSYVQYVDEPSFFSDMVRDISISCTNARSVMWRSYWILICRPYNDNCNIFKMFLETKNIRIEY